MQFWLTAGSATRARHVWRTEFRFDCKKFEDEERSEVNHDYASEDGTTKKRQRHCHCPLWKPSTELVESMKGDNNL